MITSFTQVSDNTIQCVFTKRPDLYRHITSEAGPGFTSDSLKQHLDYWYTTTGSEGAKAGKTIRSLIEQWGCTVERIDIAPELDPVPEPVAPGFPDPSVWIQQNPLLAAGGALVVLFLLFGGKRRR